MSAALVIPHYNPSASVSSRLPLDAKNNNSCLTNSDSSSVCRSSSSVDLQPINFSCASGGAESQQSFSFYGFSSLSSTVAATGDHSSKEKKRIFDDIRADYTIVDGDASGAYYTNNYRSKRNRVMQVCDTSSIVKNISNSKSLSPASLLSSQNNFINSFKRRELDAFSSDAEVNSSAFSLYIDKCTDKEEKEIKQIKFSCNTDNNDCTTCTNGVKKFEQNFNELQQEFPLVNSGLITSLLESANNNLENGRHLIHNLMQPNAYSSNYDVSNEESVSLHNKKVSKLQTKQSDKLDALINEWNKNIFKLMQTSATVDDASTKLKHCLHEFSKEIISLNSLDSGIQRNTAAQNRIQQLVSEKQLLIKAVKMQHDKIEKLQSVNTEKSYEVLKLNNELQKADSIVKKLKDAAAVYIYNNTCDTSEPYAATSVLNRRFPPDVF